MEELKGSFSCKSHPQKKLKDHLTNVAKRCKEIVEGTLSLEYSFLSPDIIKKVAYIIGFTHDFGKATSFFQKRLLGD